jgi:DMSO/TMAO reductase YedYZ molybdopterin-dependent catalytic subunit
MAAAISGTPETRSRRDRWRGVAAGVLAMLALLAVVIVTRSLFDATSLIDAMADALLLVLPMQMFSLALELFNAQAKTMMLAGLMLLLLIAGGGIGWWYAKQTAGARRVMWTRAVSIGIAVFAATILFMLLFLNDQDPSAVSLREFAPVAILLLVESAVFTVVLAVALAMFRQQDPVPGEIASEPAWASLDRRRLLTRIGAGVALVGGVAVLGRAVAKVANRPTVGVTAPGTISPAITPMEDFYIISKNFVDPTPERGDNWSIVIDGGVENELTLHKSDLETMAVAPFVSTLTCISNRIGGPLIGTAEWRGARLGDVLRKAGVGSGAVDVVFTGEDDYQDSIPIEKAMAPETMVVWEMNGQPLPRLHGEPVRVIVPGRYGIKNVKWLTRITVANKDFEGFWQERGWTDDGTIKTSSRFDVPSNKAILPIGRTQIGGVAFAGDRGISKVEVSTDGGDTWKEATIAENPSPDGFSWVIWKLDWDAREGTYDLVVRATDGTGELQTSETASELPDGASGYHRISVGIA